MNKVKTLIKDFNYLGYILSHKQKVLGFFVLALSFIGAVLETLGVTIIIPLVSAMTNAEQLMQNETVKWFMLLFHITTTTQLIICIGVGIILIYLFKNLYFILLSWIRVKYACKIRRELSINAMNAYVHKKYDYFSKVSTAEIIRGIDLDISGVYDVLYQGFRLITEALTIVLICIFIFVTDWLMALCIIVVSLICIMTVFLFFRARMRVNGERYRDSCVSNNKILLQTFEGIKEVFVLKKQEYFLDKYRKSYQNFQKAQIEMTVGSESPAYFIEGVCVAGLLGTVCIRAAFSSDISSFLPSLASFAVGAFRILPSLGRISSGINQIMFSAPSVYSTYVNLKSFNEDGEQNKTHDSLSEQSETFYDKIELKNVSWHYDDSEKNVIDNLNLSIVKGTSVGIIGSSGAGKSTLMDIILGLHIPQKGAVYMDGHDIIDIPNSWSQNVGYVPQMVFLMDDTIRNNVAFGVNSEDIDDERIWKVLEKAQLSDYINSLPQKLDTVIGEQGIRFSGGQRQRVSIARALYHNPQILVMDEATSALDNETEKAFMEAVESLQGEITMIIVAHRLSTVRSCDVIYQVENGHVSPIDKNEIFG